MIADMYLRRWSVGIRLVAAMLGGLLLCLGLAVAALAAAGDLDATFGGGGRVTVDFTAHLDGAHGVAVQADGMLVAGGVANSRNPKFALARFNADGSLDTTFGGDGKVTTDFDLGPAKAFDVALQVDGKIVAAGLGGGPRSPATTPTGPSTPPSEMAARSRSTSTGATRRTRSSSRPMAGSSRRGWLRLGTPDPRLALARFLSS
jgi:uncharacterized delta-60 repeat protein